MLNRFQAHVISIWPLPLAARRPLFTAAPNYSNVWDVPAASEEAPQVIEIASMTEQIYAGNNRYTDHMVNADDIAADLVNEWANHKAANTGHNGKPGVFLAPGLKAEYKPSDIFALPEYREAVRLSRVFAGSMVQEARDLHRQGRGRQIDPIHLLMAKLSNVTGEPWQREFQVVGTYKLCPYCETSIPNAAPVCANCHQVVDFPRFQDVQRLIRGQADPDAPVDLASIAAPVVASAAPPTPPAPATSHSGKKQ